LESPLLRGGLSASHPALPAVSRKVLPLLNEAKLTVPLPASAADADAAREFVSRLQDGGAVATAQTASAKAVKALYEALEKHSGYRGAILPSVRVHADNCSRALFVVLCHHTKLMPQVRALAERVLRGSAARAAAAGGAAVNGAGEVAIASGLYRRALDSFSLLWKKASAIKQELVSLKAAGGDVVESAQRVLARCEFLLRFEPAPTVAEPAPLGDLDASSTSTPSSGAPALVRAPSKGDDQKKEHEALQSGGVVPIAVKRSKWKKVCCRVNNVAFKSNSIYVLFDCRRSSQCRCWPPPSECCADSNT
jgi:hypothetical protein